MNDESYPLLKKYQCYLALTSLALSHWHVIRVLLIYQIPQVFLGPNRILSILSHTLWPRKSLAAAKLSLEERIMTACNDLGPIFIKFGQIISTRVDLLPPEVSCALEKLQDKVPEFSPEEAQNMIEENTQKPISQVFKKFQKKAIGSASLAQVHMATLTNNRKVIIKLLRPNIKKKIHKNLQMLYHMAKIIDYYHPNGKIIRASEVIQDYDRALRNEIDLLIEAANCSQMYRNAQNNPSVRIPRVLWKYCYKNMLVTEYVKGTEAYNTTQLSKKKIDQKKVAKDILMLFLDQTFEHNFFHADMHPGNILIDDKDPKQPIVQLVDFGIVGSLTKTDQLYIAQNLIAFFNRDYETIIRLHIESGWIPNIDNQQNMMNEIRAIGEPLYAKPLKEISFGKVLGELFQIARQYQMIVQPQLILLQKTIFNIEALARRLDPDLNLWESAKPYVENWINNQYSVQKSLSNLSNQLPKLIYDLSQYRQPQKNIVQRAADPEVTQTPSYTIIHIVLAAAVGFSISYLWAQS